MRELEFFRQDKAPSVFKVALSYIHIFLFVQQTYTTCICATLSLTHRPIYLSYGNCVQLQFSLP